ncbi:MAG: hypothetical protein CL811_01260 [Colwelliaceae bacterium]|nr:hypothetical protein [Colwelliaceae bacterium]
MASKDKGDFVEIPIGKFFSKFKTGSLRENPWIAASAVLAIVLLVVLFTGGSLQLSPGGVSADEAAANLIAFINGQGRGEATLVSSEREGEFYNIVVSFEGEQVPVYVSLSGDYLITDLVPISDDIGPVGSGRVVDTGGVQQVELGNAPVKGDASAPVTIVEFSDYECPFCGKFYSETLPQIEENYIKTGKVKLVFKDFPLGFHANAEGAAVAARCAGALGGDEDYYEMHDLLFENQQGLNRANYVKWAGQVGVSQVNFEKCLDSGEHESKVQADLLQGQSLGVTGTPGFLINGKLVSGAQPYSVFEQAIEAELA